MPAARTPRAEWVTAGLRALATGGPDAVRIEAIAKSLGVTKGGFYGYFPDRAALLSEMLGYWEREVTDQIIQRVEADDGDARERLRNLFHIVTTREGVPVELGTELAIREWARRDPAVAERLRAVDARQFDYLRGLLGEICTDEDDVETRLTIIVSVLVTTHLVAFDHSERTHQEIVQRIIDQVLV